MLRRVVRTLALAPALVLTAGIFVYLHPAIVQAQSALGDEKKALITASCTSAQLNLQQLQKRDAVSRINRGRAYDQMLQQIKAFQSRLAYNKMSAPDINAHAASMQSQVDQFRAAYIRYDEAVSGAIKINCKEKPGDFYAFIEKAREDRSTLGAKVGDIDTLMGNYRDAVRVLQRSLPGGSE